MLGPHDTRDQVVDFVRAWADKTDIPVCRFLPWIGVGASKFHDWKRRFGKVNEHNAWSPAITGSPSRRRRPSASSPASTPWKAIAARPS